MLLDPALQQRNNFFKIWGLMLALSARLGSPDVRCTREAFSVVDRRETQGLLLLAKVELSFADRSCVSTRRLAAITKIVKAAAYARNSS